MTYHTTNWASPQKEENEADAKASSLWHPLVVVAMQWQACLWTWKWSLVHCPAHKKAGDWQPTWNQSSLSKRAHPTVKCDPKNSHEKPSSNSQERKQSCLIAFKFTQTRSPPPPFLSISSQMHSPCQQNFTYVMQKHIAGSHRKDIK